VTNYTLLGRQKGIRGGEFETESNTDLGILDIGATVERLIPEEFGCGC
jgi:hypothetical protein